MHRFAAVVQIIVFACLTTYSQEKLVIDDRANLLSEEVEELITAKLAEENIEYTTVVDYKARCEYYFTELSFEKDNVILTVKDCNDRVLGSKNLGNRILSTNPQERSFLLSYSISDIITNPGEYLRAPLQTKQEAAGGNDVELSGEEVMIENEHNTRYFFAPSAYNLKKGDLYYNTVYFFLHDIQYGMSDNFSIGLGTSLIGLPIYLTPKLSIPVGKKSAFALGDMLIFGTYGTRAIGNLVYGNFSTGGPQGNVSFGAGYLATNESDITSKTSSLVLNFSGMARVSPYIFLLTENYFFGLNTVQYAYDDWYDEATGNWMYRNEEFIQRLGIWYGILGIRIISKNRDFVSWQFGLTYVMGVPGAVPDEYYNWDTSGRDGVKLIAFPALSYTRKFGHKY